VRKKNSFLVEHFFLGEGRGEGRQEEAIRKEELKKERRKRLRRGHYAVHNATELRKDEDKKKGKV